MGWKGVPLCGTGIAAFANKLGLAREAMPEIIESIGFIELVGFVDSCHTPSGMRSFPYGSRSRSSLPIRAKVISGEALLGIFTAGLYLT